MMNKHLERYKSLFTPDRLAAFVVGLCAFLFWGWAFPHALSYREQYQLFLCTGDYFLDEVKTAGGFVQYLGEFLVQFFIYEWLGALILGILFGLITYLVMRLMDGKQRVLALVIPVLLLWHMGDENVMLSYPVAIIIAILSYMVMRKLHPLVDIILLPLMYWLIGPVVWLYALLRNLPQPLQRRGDAIRSVHSFFGAAGRCLFLLAVQLGSGLFVLRQWPTTNVVFGMWYYRYEDILCNLQILIPLLIVVIVKCHHLFAFDKRYILQTVMVLLLLFFAIPLGFNKDKYELIRQDYLIRNQRWSEVVRNAEAYTVQTEFWSESVNLALAKTGQLSSRMFSFYQSGPDALIMPMHRDMTSNLPSMEAFYQLGMTNECLRYAFDLQESIPLGKKSGRLSMRIVECCIVSERYDVAKKYIALLKKSLFYRVWAERMEGLIEYKNLIDGHQIYGRMRKNAFKDDFLFYYPELAKVFYMLFISNTDNKMALEYMLGQVLLEGDANMFLQLVGAVNQYGGYSSMPYTYQDAIECIQAKGQKPGSRYGEYAKRMKDIMNQSQMMNNESAH